MSAAGTTTPLNPDAKTLFAEFGVRMGAAGLDVFIPLFVADVIDLTIIDQEVTTLAALLLYFSLFWSSPMRATPVQFLFGMRVVDEMGGTLNLRRAIIRSIALIGLIFAAMMVVNVPTTPYFGAIALVGYAFLFLAALTPNRQAGHDLLARTIVVNKIALNSPEHLTQLREHVFGSDPVSRKQRRPSVLSIAGNLIVLGIPMFAIHSMYKIGYDRELQVRTGYALSAVFELQTAVEEFYAERIRWPASDSALGAATKGHYPDGGYYELEDHGVIRIHFTVNPDLMKGSIVLNSSLEDDVIVWKCRSDGDIARSHLPDACRE
jgi:uncharacterized RDD family membrane protein YckC